MGDLWERFLPKLIGQRCILEEGEFRKKSKITSASIVVKDNSDYITIELEGIGKIDSHRKYTGIEVREHFQITSFSWKLKLPDWSKADKND